MTEDHDDEMFADVRADRRAFVKGVVAVTAFAAPMIASYDLQGLSPSVAQAAVSNVSNLLP
jgi:hypothetical protein